LPFWLAGGYGRPAQLLDALKEGAAGIQVGTAFAYSAESGMRPDYKQAVLEQAKAGTARVFTDPLASPSGFPFKVVQLEGTASDEKTYKARPRICDLGYLREAYRTPEGTIGFRCASEPISVYLSKGGDIAETEGRKCICNALMATMGTPQSRAGGKIVEAGIITSGDDLVNLRRYLPENGTEYHASDVIRILLSGLKGTEFEHLIQLPPSQSRSRNRLDDRFGRAGHETVADAAHCPQMVRTRRHLFDIAPQAEDEVVDRPRVSILSQPQTASSIVLRETGLPSCLTRNRSRFASIRVSRNT